VSDPELAQQVHSICGSEEETVTHYLHTHSTATEQWNPLSWTLLGLTILSITVRYPWLRGYIYAWFCLRCTY